MSGDAAGRDERDETGGGERDDDGSGSGGDGGAGSSGGGDGDAASESLTYYVDGDLVAAADAAVSVRDRGFLYGDAAFETVRVYGGTPWRWDAHVDRLFGSLDRLGMPADELGLTADGLRERVDETLAANGLADASVRLSVTRGETDGFTPPPATETEPTVVALVTPLPRGGRADRGGESVWDGPATLQTAKTRRVPDRSLPSDAKTHNYLNGVLARAETRVSDADEAVLLDADGDVAECATANLFFVADDVVRTPSLAGPVLPGVTRRVVLDVVRDEGFPVEEGSYAPDDVRAADEAFITSSIREIRPVGVYDGVTIGDDPEPGPVTRLVSRLYDQRVEAACYGERGGADADSRDGPDAADAGRDG
ncbi:aminotransferase class IV [Halobaculum sp. D14]|uniref:aminotransferase class IV n=1 Tax=Halobaculum sp. D14 TaxID=3421642 RepID=UPI003EB9C5BB